MDKKLQLLLSLFIYFSICASSQDFKLTFLDSCKSFTIENELIELKSQWILPELSPKKNADEWIHVENFDNSFNLARVTGIKRTDIFSNNGIILERELWQSYDKRYVAIRQRIVNKSFQDINLDKLFPFAVQSAEDFSLKKNPDPDQWKIMVQKRFKNDFPETVIPGVNTKIKADPFLAFPVNSDLNGPVLLIGYLNWTIHLADIQMNFKEINNKTVFNEIITHCNFNNVQIPAGGSRTSQWIYLSIGKNMEETINEYAEQVGVYHDINAPSDVPPSLYCSWYYYGLHYTEDYFMSDMHALEKQRMPFDVFLIDESWALHRWGDFTPNERFPSGMKNVADKINELGYVAGIWTCPYLVSPESNLAKKHPEWLVKKSNGDYYTFRMNGLQHYVFDPTYPGALEYLEESYRKISRDWGYNYFKFDFMRAIFLDLDFQLHDPKVTRLEAYRTGLEAIRRGVGKDAYISVCGGHFGGSIGLANSQRSGSDVHSVWDKKELAKYRQNLLRTWMARFWHVDPDAMMVRRSEEEIDGLNYSLTQGKFTDNEAQINALNQYINGQLVTFTEPLATIDNDRMELYKHVIPSVNSPSFPVDWHNQLVPSYLITQVAPLCKQLNPWNNIAIINWSDEMDNFSFTLDSLVLKTLPGDKFLLFEFFSQEVMGLYNKSDLVRVEGLASRTAKLYKIIPWSGKESVLAGTNLHFSMGGVEIKEWNATPNAINGYLETQWPYPVEITAVFPVKNGFKTEKIITYPHQKRFWIKLKNKE